MRILIADDHALFRDSLATLLAAQQYEVVGQACDGRQAVDMASKLKPDLVLMDLGMPELDGLEATRILAARADGPRVVILTGTDDDDKLFEAIKSGAQGYLLKNLEADEFFALIQRIARGRARLDAGGRAQAAAESSRTLRRAEEPTIPTHSPIESVKYSSFWFRE